MKNLLSFDLENWYDSEFIVGKRDTDKDFVLAGLKRITTLLDKHKIKATFFVTGAILENYPREIKALHEHGHEIASHSFEHKMLNKMSKEEVKKNVRNSREKIKKTVGASPLGFRAPSWSITKNEFWIYQLLEKLGFEYSSSLFPVYMGLYGSSKFPTTPFSPKNNMKFTELPITPFKLGWIRIPFSGGIYFRIWPKYMIEFFIKRLNKENKGVILYLHPWEFCPDIPRVKTSLVGRVTTYWGLKRNYKKLDYILSRFKFSSMKGAIKNERV